MFAYQGAQKNEPPYQQHPVVCIVTDFFGASLSGLIFYFGSGWLARRKERKLKQVGDDKFYDEVARELQGIPPIPGLWTKAYAEMGGDDAKARALYIKYRVANLKEEERNARIKLQREEEERKKEETRDRATMKLRLMTICKKCGFAGCMNPTLIEPKNHVFFATTCKCPKCSHRFDWYYVPSKNFPKAQS
jgi:DNA-directed RNA polymerase subunit M/transcription elongation factor TFIIS